MAAAPFQSNTRSMFDVCAGGNKDVMNTSVYDYTMSSFRSNPGTEEGSKARQEEHLAKLNEFVASNKNLHMKGARGPEPSLIDVESRLRNNVELTHDKERRQVAVRNFVAGPDLARGELLPTLEHVLQSGAGLGAGACAPVREAMYDEFPMNPTVAHMVRGNNLALNSWDAPSIGESSKDILRRFKSGQK